MRSRLILLFLCVFLIGTYGASKNSLDTIEEGYETVLPLNWNKIIGSVFLLILIVLAVIGGLGGGTICVHILLLFFKMDVVHSAAISNTVITISALVQYAGFYAAQKHPNLNAPITDYSIAVLLLPMTLLGAKCGLLAYRILSSSILLLFLTIVTLVFSVLTIMKGVKLFQKSAPPPRSIPQADNREVGQYGIPAIEAPPAESIPLFPIGKISFMLFMMLMILLADVFQGSKYTTSILSISNCGVAYFIIFGVIALLTILFTFVSYKIVKQDTTNANLNLDSLAMVKIMFIAFICGFLLSSTGLGGGMTLNPLLLQMGIIPEVTAATTVFVLLITTFATSVLLTLHGFMLVGYFILFNVLSIIATIGARLGANFLCRDRFRAQASIIFCVGGVLIFTAILIPIVVFTRGTSLADIFALKNFCG